MADDRKVTCDQCKKDIPRSVALTVEGQDYIHNFCSLDCQEHFFQDNPKLKTD